MYEIVQIKDPHIRACTWQILKYVLDIVLFRMISRWNEVEANRSFLLGISHYNGQIPKVIKHALQFVYVLLVITWNIICIVSIKICQENVFPVQVKIADPEHSKLIQEWY